MIDVLRWLFMLEVVGIVFLPLTLWMFRRLPDRGYILSKIMGLVLLTFGTWIVGSFLPIASGIALPIAVLASASALCWWALGTDVPESLRAIRNVIVLEEVLFLAAFVVWCLMRAYVFHPGIEHTEQYMDMSLLGASIKSGSYPPYDPWMSGHTINYYYLGYLMFGIATKLAGVVPTVGYNLAISTLFSTTICGAFSIGLALTRKALWAALAPLFVALIGNWYSIFTQLPKGVTPGSFNWFWNSTRVVGNGNTINEFPYFSFMLGDLHPHVMALPVTLLAISLCIAFVISPVSLLRGRSAATWTRIAVTAACVGSLYAMNSWDFPTYALLVVGCIGAGAYVADPSVDWWKPLARVIPVLGVLSLALYAPFYLEFKAPTRGFGWVSTPSNFGEFLEVFGLFLLAAVITVTTYGFLFQPADEPGVDEEQPTRSSSTALEAGQARALDSPYFLTTAVAACAIVLGLRFHIWVLMAMIGLLYAAGVMLHRALNTDEPNRADVLALLMLCLGCFVVALPEIVYIRDVFDGGASYRLNTVFKFYYQGWTLLGLAAAYGAFRSIRTLREIATSWVSWMVACGLALGILAGLVYTLEAPQSAEWGGIGIGLDGSSGLRDAAPADMAAIEWLRRHDSGNHVVLEAVGASYAVPTSDVSTFTGLPTVMGWSGHEPQWRGDDPEIQQRIDDVNTIYTTRNASAARSLLRKYHVRYVFVGTNERAISGADLSKFRNFMHVAFRGSARGKQGATVYTW